MAVISVVSPGGDSFVEPCRHLCQKIRWYGYPYFIGNLGYAQIGDEASEMTKPFVLLNNFKNEPPNTEAPFGARLYCTRRNNRTNITTTPVIATQFKTTPS